MSPKSFLSWIAAVCLSVVMILILVPLMLVFFVGMLTAAISPEKVASFDGAKRVAVVELSGVIIDSKEIIDSLYTQAEDKSVKGIVLRVNSPGGAVGPSQEIYSVVKKIAEKKPLVALMTGVAASGGLYSTLGATKIYCQPGTLTGSIGVILQVPNVSKIADDLGFKMTTVKSGALKDVGNAFRPMAAQEEAYLQSTIDEAHKQFVQAISESRNLPIEKINKFADGRVILGSQAVEYGLVDGFGDTRFAAREIFNLLNEPLDPDENPVIFYPEDKLAWVKEIMNSASSWTERLQGSVQFKYLLQ